MILKFLYWQDTFKHYIIEYWNHIISVCMRRRVCVHVSMCMLVCLLMYLWMYFFFCANFHLIFFMHAAIYVCVIMCAFHCVFPSVICMHICLFMDILLRVCMCLYTCMGVLIYECVHNFLFLCTCVTESLISQIIKRSRKMQFHRNPTHGLLRLNKKYKSSKVDLQHLFSFLLSFFFTSTSILKQEKTAHYWLKWRVGYCNCQSRHAYVRIYYEH